jgi:hypothetical protein
MSRLHRGLIARLVDYAYGAEPTRLWHGAKENACETVGGRTRQTVGPGAVGVCVAMEGLGTR